jgi:serine/threonine-protein kinase
MAKRQPTARAGKKLGRYVIERELGRGGMGVVYVARDENLGRRVALKTTSVAGLGGGEKTRTQRRRRFIREVQALSQVSHENVVHVYDAGEADDPDLGWLLFYSMQFVEGITLAELVQRHGPMDAGAAAAVCQQVAAGLGAGHLRGIVHRDVKPANIFLSHAGRALIGDFGIAKIEGSTQITRRDQLVGTPNYLAPEQILGDAVTAATDVFALGALFYVVVSNRPLRTKLDAQALLAAAKGNDAKEKILAEKSLPSGLRKVVARALEREPKKRWKDGQHFADALAEYATRIPALEVSAPEPPPPQAAEKPPAAGGNPFGSFSGPAAAGVAPQPKGPPGAPGDPNTMSAVEQAAKALLNEVAEQRGPEPEPEKDKPLPVARTESTVMFNLRAEEEKQKKAKEEEEGNEPLLEPVSGDGNIPVARTESTVVFNLRKVTEGKPDATVTEPGDTSDAPIDGDTLDPEDDVTASGDEHEDALAFEESTDTALTRRPQPVVREVVPPPPKKPRPPLDERRVRFIGAAGGGGFILGLLTILIVAITGRATETVLPNPVLDGPGPAKSAATRTVVPSHCGSPAAGDKARTKAKDALSEARKQRAAGKYAGARRSLRQALEQDGHNAAAHYEMASLRSSIDSDVEAARKHYECVVILDPKSEIAQKAGRVLQAVGKAQRGER